MQRPSATGLATAFFRLYVLDALAAGPARPNALLVRIAAERLPFAAGAFSRAVQSLMEGGHLQPAPHGAVALSALGAAERMAERERWRAVLPTVERLLDMEIVARPEPPSEETPAPRRVSDVADDHLDRVLVPLLRDRIVAAREGGRAFVLALGTIDLEHASVAHRRAMLHRTIRATLGSATSLFGSDVDAFRYGDAGIALLAPETGARALELALLLRTRLDELVRTAVTTVRAFGGARWNVRAGAAAWSPAIVTSAALLRAAQDALAHDGELTAA